MEQMGPTIVMTFEDCCIPPLPHATGPVRLAVVRTQIGDTHDIY